MQWPNERQVTNRRKTDNTSNVENLDDFPIDDMDSILLSIENFEEIPIAQQLTFIPAIEGVFVPRWMNL
jgi:hypothetical protein